MSGVADLSIRSLPYLDEKWLRADLYGALQNTEDLAVLWNNLIKDNELVTSCSGAGGGTTTLVSGVTVNSAGHLSYIGNNGRHYCGQQKLLCSCCTGFCRPMSECNCSACHQLDMEEPTKKNSSGSHQSLPPSDSILDSWLWGPIPSMSILYPFNTSSFYFLVLIAPEEKATCIKSLLSEQRDLSLQAAGHSLSAVHLRQRLYIYQRYFTALARYKPQKVETVKRSLDMASPSFDAKLQVGVFFKPALSVVCMSVCANIKHYAFSIVEKWQHRKCTPERCREGYAGSCTCWNTCCP